MTSATSGETTTAATSRSALAAGEMRPAASTISDEALADVLPAVPAYRHAQIRRGIYGGSARGFDQITPLPQPLRQLLDTSLTFSSVDEQRVQVAADGTRKFLFRAADATVFETVQLPSERGAATSVCVSSQAGCSLACTFCATGMLGLTRNLTAAEIVDQFLHVRRESPEQTAPDRIIFMGMGEPLANLTQVRDAVEVLVDPARVGLGARHITVSTVGLPAGIARIAGWPWQVGLAISLHAASDDVRATLVPLARHIDIQTLMDFSVAYQRATRRRVSYEYTVLEGVNDSLAQARDLARLISGQTCHVNLIPFNPFPGAPYAAPDRETVRRFRNELQRQGIVATIRRTRGSEIAGACGQLQSLGAAQRNGLSNGAAPPPWPACS